MLPARWKGRQIEGRRIHRHSSSPSSHGVSADRALGCFKPSTPISAQFWSDPESGVDLDVNITVRDGPNHGYVYYSPPFLTILVTRCRFDESFVRNFYGYLSSVTMQGLSPNPLQMLAFMDGADVVLVFPLNIGRLLNVVLGRWFGRWLAGYQTEYKEFAED